MPNALNWFEIPVADMTRAKTFYGAIFDIEMAEYPASEGYTMAMFPAENGVGGALMHGEGCEPSYSGSTVYLNGGNDLSTILTRVAAAGGKVLMDKYSIGEDGFVGVFEDSEGNRVGLHSMG